MKLQTLHCFLFPLLALAFAGPADNSYEVAIGAAQSTWEGWAKTKAGGLDAVEKSYKAQSSPDQRVLIWSPRGTSASKLMKTSKKSIKQFDDLFKGQARSAGAPEKRVAVLFPIVGPKSFARITAQVGRAVPRLAGWGTGAVKGVGFLLEEPLSAGWLLKVPNSEVWNVENELVNRLARLLTIERFGRQPHWLAQGIAWHIEQKVCKDVYCFPYRNGFVSRKEHKSWSKRLPLVMAARGDRALSATDLHGWTRDSWNADSAVLASGAVDMLAKHYSAELPKVLDAFMGLRNKDGRTTEADGSWQVIPNYEIPADQEQQILNESLGHNFLEQFERYARAPKRYRRP
jgi:hypothetical protein